MTIIADEVLEITTDGNMSANEQQSRPAERPVSSGLAGPAIRTMSSDIDELLKTRKSTLLQIMTKEAPQAEHAPPRAVYQTRKMRSIVMIIMGVALIGGVVGGGVWYFFPLVETPLPSGQWVAPPTPGTAQPQLAPVKIPTPPALFNTAGSRIITIPADDRSVFLKFVTDTLQEPEREKTITRILIKIQNGQDAHYASLTEFFNLWHVVPPPNFLQHVDGSLMFFIFYGPGGPRIGFVTKTTDANRTLSDIFFWEQSLASDLKLFFFQEQIRPPEPPLFEDRTSSNTDWRYLKLSTQKDLGIGYMIFQANRLVVFTTSKESMESIIKTFYGTQ